MSSTTSPTLPHAVGAASVRATAMPPDATEFNVGVSSGSSPVGGTVHLILTPAKGAWPSGMVLTPQATGIQGKFVPDTQIPIGIEPAYFQFVPSAPGTGTLTAVASFAAVSSAPTAPTPTPSPTPAPTPTPTPAPAPTSDGTLTGLPATIVAGQPLSAATYGQSAPYFVLYRVAGAVEEGVRWASSVMPGNLTLLIPQTAGAYTVRGYDAATAGNKVYESAQFNVTAAPGALPATPTQAADTGTTSSGTTMNWSATGTSYRVLARPGVGTVYGSLADTTVSTNSFTFTGRPASSSPRAVVIPQNANGYGTPSGQFLSFTTA
jgi:hypothetical protein